MKVTGKTDLHKIYYHKNAKKEQNYESIMYLPTDRNDKTHA